MYHKHGKSSSSRGLILFWGIITGSITKKFNCQVSLHNKSNKLLKKSNTVNVIFFDILCYNRVSSCCHSLLVGTNLLLIHCLTNLCYKHGFNSFVYIFVVKECMKGKGKDSELNPGTSKAVEDCTNIDSASHQMVTKKDQFLILNQLPSSRLPWSLFHLYT